MKSVFSAGAQDRATLIGLFGPLAWGSTVALVRIISESFGMAQGQALLYAVAAAALFFVVGLPNRGRFRGASAALIVLCACLSSVTFCLAVHLSPGGLATMAVAMAYYVHPALTMLFAVMLNGVRVRLRIIPGVFLAFAGVVITSGGAEFSAPALLAHLSESPAAYALALSSAALWALYSNLARRFAGGENPSTVIFAVNAAVFALLWVFGFGESAPFSIKGLAAVLAGGAVMGAAYAAWTHGMQHGRPVILASAAYAIPFLSTLFGWWWLDAAPGAGFWTGLALLAAGSVLCGTAQKPAAGREEAPQDLDNRPAAAPQASLRTPCARASRR